MSEPKRYVVGFLFDGYKIALIQKNRPEWQKGLWNGVGGHIEKGELPDDAMEREFLEETGCRVGYWREYALLTNDKRSVELYLYTATMRDNQRVETVTDEEVAWHDIERLPENIIPNLKWLIPMAHHDNHFMAEIKFATDMW